MRITLRILALTLLFILSIAFLTLAGLVNAHTDPTYQLQRRKSLNSQRLQKVAKDIGISYNKLQSHLQKGSNLKEIMNQSKISYNYFQM